MKSVLDRYGLPVTRERSATYPTQAIKAAETVGWPVAPKGFGADIIHKSDEGTVALNLADAQALKEAWTAMQKRLGARLVGCIVAEMASGEAEAIPGIQNDAQFGPILLVGLGSVLAEVLNDVILLPCLRPSRAHRRTSAQLTPVAAAGGRAWQACTRHRSPVQYRRPAFLACNRCPSSS